MWSRVGGRLEERSEGAEMVLTVKVLSERVFFLLVFFFRTVALSLCLFPAFIASTNCLSSFPSSVTYSSVF